MKEGKIINLADVAGQVIWPGYLAYSVSKAALLAVNRGLAKAYAPHIQVNAVAPGAVLSNIIEQAIQAEKKAPELAAARRKVKESGGVPADLSAELVAFLLGPKARSIHLDFSTVSP